MPIIKKVSVFIVSCPVLSMSAKYMDDIKLYATSERDVNSLIH